VSDSSRKKASPAALEKIMRYLNRVDRPTYMGFIALEIGYSLAQTLAMMQELEEAGQVRLLTVEDLKRLKLDERANIWELTERAHPSKARW